jgi:hypothetical protein
MRTLRHLAIAALALGGTALGGAFVGTTPASAGVSVGIGIGVPGIYGTYRIRTGPCSRPRFAYMHPYQCGYPRFSEPVFIDGVWVNEPLYYRTYGGNRFFWYRGRWVAGHGSWDGRIFRGDWRRDWRARGWDREEVRDRMEEHRENMRDRMGDRRDDMRDRDRDRRPGGNDRDDRPHDRDKDNDHPH